MNPTPPNRCMVPLLRFNRTAGQVLLAILSGVLIVVSFEPWNLWPIGCFAFVPLQIALVNVSPRRAAALGGICGGIVYGGGFGWVVPVISELQSLSSPAAASLFILFIAYHLIPFAGSAALAATVASATTNRFAAAFLVAGSWVSVDAIFPEVIPWSPGSVWNVNPILAQASDLGGMSLLSLLSLMPARLIAEAILRRPEQSPVSRMIHLTAAGSIVLLTAAYGCLRLWQESSTAIPDPGNRSVRVVVVQGVTTHLMNDQASLAAGSLEIYGRETRKRTAQLSQSPPDLIVWPETVLRSYLRLDHAVRGELDSLVNEFQAPVLLGALDLVPGDAGEINAAFLAKPGAGEGGPPMYAKSRLLPFGEYLPAADLLPLPAAWKTTGRFVPARTTGSFSLMASSDRKHAPTMALALCNEAVVPGWFNDAVRDGATFLINPSDDGWFAGTSAPLQHLAAVRLRAIETRRWMVRASDSGISAIIDPSGRIVGSLAYGQRGSLLATIPLRDDLTWYVRLGDWPIWLSAAITSAAVALRLVSVPWRSRENCLVETSLS